MPAGSVYEQRPGAAGRPLPDGYQRRTPERTVLYELVSEYREPMLRHMREVDPKGCPVMSTASSRPTSGVES